MKQVQNISVLYQPLVTVLRILLLCLCMNVLSVMNESYSYNGSYMINHHH